MTKTMDVVVTVEVTSGPVHVPALEDMVRGMRKALIEQGRKVGPVDSEDNEEWTFEVSVVVDAW